MQKMHGAFLIQKIGEQKQWKRQQNKNGLRNARHAPCDGRLCFQVAKMFVDLG